MGFRASFLLFVLLVASWGAAHAHASQDRKLGKVHVSHGSGSPLCSPCENFANEAVSYLNQKQTQDKIIAFLHDACSQTFSLEQKCAELMDSYAALLFAKITEIKPEEFCAHYGLCRNNDLLSVKSESTCVFCHHLVDEVMSKLKDPDAEFEIIQILLKECNKVEGHVQQCKRLVLQYIPLILVNGEKFLEKNDLCALVQACPASQKRTVSWFLDGELVSDA
ncbi:unnamed protein product [Urochloa decumbens]|uniref:Saposin B-type domain-containing protein n=1 Tax=Urochloa decumbens TaxID=240449 RepID=A0ABC9HBQ7_9POAL